MKKMERCVGRLRACWLWAWSLPVADSEPAMLMTQRDNLLEVLVRLFADRLLAAARRGLPHRYLFREDDLPLLCGKLDIRRQLLHHAVRPDRLACRFDELSVDTPLNRVLKAVVARLASGHAPSRMQEG